MKGVERNFKEEEKKEFGTIKTKQKEWSTKHSCVESMSDLLIWFLKTHILQIDLW